MKREMSSFDIMVLLQEVRPLIISSIIDNLYQINMNTILLKLRKSRQPPLWMVIESGKRFNLTSYSFERPKKPTQFCMALRKYVKGGVISDLKQHEFERIITLSIDAPLNKFFLVCEFFSGGNIILTDGEFKILHALHYRRMRDRNIIRGEKLVFPPPSGFNPLLLKLEDLEEMKKISGVQVVRALTKFLSIGGLYAEEILVKASIDKNTPSENLKLNDLEGIYRAIQHIIKLAGENVSPQIIFDDEGNYIDVIPFELKKYEGFKRINLKSFNEALDDYYSKLYVEDLSRYASEKFEKEIAKYSTILKKQEEDYNKLKEEKVRHREIGNVIYRHMDELTHLKSIIKEYRDKGLEFSEITSILDSNKRMNILPYVYFERLDPNRNVLEVTVEGCTFSISISGSIHDDAKTYYERAKKVEKKLEGLERAMEEMNEKIRKMREEEGTEKEMVGALSPLKRRRWYEKFRWFYSSDGFLVVGGRDATTNDILIKRHMEPYDIVLHAEVAGAPFVLIKTEGKKPLQETFKEAAVFAASYSKAWAEGLESVDVYWVNPDQLSWSPPPGQYLRRGSFIVKGDKNYLRGIPLRAAIGITVEDGVEIIGGPPEAISKRTKFFVEIKPGRVKSGSLAKRIKERIMKSIDEKYAYLVKRLSLEEIQSFLPPGGGEIV